MKILFWVFNILFALNFLASAIVQWNDPDPLLWLVTYVAALVACFISPRSPSTPGVLLVVLVATLLWGLSLAPAIPQVHVSQLVSDMKMKTVEVEEARESLGLLMVSFWMLVLLVRTRSFLRPVEDPLHAD